MVVVLVTVVTVVAMSPRHSSSSSSTFEHDRPPGQEQQMSTVEDENMIETVAVPTTGKVLFVVRDRRLKDTNCPALRMHHS